MQDDSEGQNLQDAENDPGGQYLQDAERDWFRPLPEPAGDAADSLPADSPVEAMLPQPGDEPAMPADDAADSLSADDSPTTPVETPAEIVITVEGLIATSAPQPADSDPVGQHLADDLPVADDTTAKLIEKRGICLTRDSRKTTIVTESAGKPVPGGSSFESLKP